MHRTCDMKPFLTLMGTTILSFCRSALFKAEKTTPLRRHKAPGGERVCDGRWTQRGKPHHLLQTSARQRYGFSQQWKPLDQLPCHRGAIPCQVSGVVIDTSRQVKRALFVFSSSGSLDAFDMSCSGEHSFNEGICFQKHLKRSF